MVRTKTVMIVSFSGRVKRRGCGALGTSPTSAGTDRTARVWRATGRQDVAVLHGHTGPVVGVDEIVGGLEMVRSSSSMPPPPVGSQAQLVRVTDGAELALKVHL